MKTTTSTPAHVEARARAIFDQDPSIADRLPYINATGRTEKGLRCDHAKVYGFLGHEVGIFYRVASEVKAMRYTR